MMEERINFSFTIQELQYLVDVVAARPIKEALPLFLKLTQQTQQSPAPPSPTKKEP